MAATHQQAALMLVRNQYPLGVSTTRFARTKELCNHKKMLRYFICRLTEMYAVRQPSDLILRTESFICYELFEVVCEALVRVHPIDSTGLWWI